MNAANVEASQIELVVDGSTEKQGKYLPGSRVPVRPPTELTGASPSDVLILPWNIAPELATNVATLAPGARCWVAVPTMTEVHLA